MNLAPLDDADWPLELADMRFGFAGKLNIYRVMAHRPALLRAWTDLRSHVVEANALTPEQREVAILRTGCRWGSQYEWGQHVVRGRAAGLTDARIAACRRPPDPADDSDDAAIIRVVDHLLEDGELPAPLRDAIIARLGEHGLFDLMATVGMYTTLAFIAKSFAVPLEPEVMRALAQDPLRDDAAPASAPRRIG